MLHNTRVVREVLVFVMEAPAAEPREHPALGCEDVADLLVPLSLCSDEHGLAQAKLEVCPGFTVVIT